MQLLIHAARRPQMMRVPLLIMEDNEAVIKILLKGRSNALRHLHRTHRINIDWMFAIIKQEHILIRYVNTKYQLADICTKAFTKAEDWQRLMQMRQIRPNKVAKSNATIQKRKRGQRGHTRSRLALAALSGLTQASGFAAHVCDVSLFCQFESQNFTLEQTRGFAAPVCDVSLFHQCESLTNPIFVGRRVEHTSAEIQS